MQQLAPEHVGGRGRGWAIGVARIWGVVQVGAGRVVCDASF